MARKQQPPIDAPANPQTESKLLSMPPELRTIIWELALHAEPNANGLLVLQKFRDRNGGNMAPSSVLTLLLTCRFILREAAGIFYAQHPISFIHKSIDTKACIESRRFTKDVRSPFRLAGIQKLHLQAFNLEDLTMITNTISQSFLKLKVLRCRVSFGDDNFQALESEVLLLKRAVSRLPAGLEVFKVDYRLRSERVAWQDFRAQVRKILEAAFAKLPKGAKGEISMTIW